MGTCGLMVTVVPTFLCSAFLWQNNTLNHLKLSVTTAGHLLPQNHKIKSCNIPNSDKGLLLPSSESVDSRWIDSLHLIYHWCWMAAAAVWGHHFGAFVQLVPLMLRCRRSAGCVKEARLTWSMWTGRKSGLESLMRRSRSVTCPTGTISLNHLVWHSEASVHRMLISRAPECFLGKMATLRLGSYSKGVIL